MDNNIDILIGKYLSGNTNEEETKTLFNWIKRHPDNEREFKKAETLWNKSAGLGANRSRNAEAAWQEFESLAKAKPANNTKTWALRAAASAAGLILLTVLIRFLVPVETNTTVAENKPTAAPTISKVEPAIQEEIRDTSPVKQTTNKPAPKTVRYTTSDSAIVFLLPDSSKVYLNKNSKLTLASAFGKTERRLILTGEAFFEVKHLNTPFIVTCGKTLVHDIGTSFNIKAYAGDSLIEVSVLTGSVEFYSLEKNAPGPMMIKEGSCGLYHTTAATFEKTKISKKNLKWWKGKNIKNRIKEFFDKLKGKRHE